MKKLTALVAILTCAVILLCSCGVNVVGKWVVTQDIFGSDVTVSSIEFFKDGTFKRTAVGISTDGTYKLDGDTVVLTTVTFGIESSTTYIVEINGDTMRLIDFDGVATVYKKQ